MTAYEKRTQDLGKDYFLAIEACKLHFMATLVKEGWAFFWVTVGDIMRV